MAKLWEIADLVRSKNAGPFHFTFDIIISDAEDYRRLKATEEINTSLIAELYDVDEENVSFVTYDEANAFKISIPRRHSSGSLRDGDVMGGQHHAPLVDLEVDLETTE